MKAKFLFIIFILLHGGLMAGSGQKTLRTIKHDAFKPGEVLNFRIHYGIIDAGTATLEVKPDLRKIGNRDCYHLVGTGQSTGAFDWFFKVRDRYESVVDVQSIVPWLFIRRINEGGYVKNQNVSFNHYKDSASSEKATIAIPEYTQDLISAFYYARTIDMNSLKEGDIIPITGYLDDEIIPLNIKFIGRENVKTKLGTFRCLVFRPMLLEGRVFKEEEDMTVWISDDKNRIPVRVQSNILVGSIKMDITGYKNLANEPALTK